jgi:hypothetical protein
MAAGGPAGVFQLINIVRNPGDFIQRQVTGFLCGSSPQDAIVSSVTTSGIRGAISGVGVGAAGFGGVTAGLGAVPGGVAGDVIGAGVGAGSGAITGVGRAGLCAVFGGYDRPAPPTRP